MSLQSQDARLRRHRQQDEQRLQKLQGDRRYLEAKKQQERERIAAAQQALNGTAAAASQPGGFEFRNNPASGRSAGRMTAAEYAARFCQRKGKGSRRRSLTIEAANAPASPPGFAR